VPSRKVRVTVSSTALKNAYGIAPSSTARRKPIPEPTGAGVVAQVDQRVLLGQLRQRRVQGALLRTPHRLDHGLQAGSPTLSRTRTAPSNIGTYAIFSPAGPRSTLNTVPDAGPPESGAGAATR
jgi:hypothetical protein